MAVVVDGPNVSYWEDWMSKLDTILGTEDTSSIGASVQQSGNAGEGVAIRDQLIGKVGPMIGKWDPEKGNRMIQEF